VNALGNLGGYFGPLLVGYMNKRTGSLVDAFGLLSLSLLVGTGLALFLPERRRTEGQ
jgi:MFS transporter, ACS family, tartrate transporter